MILFIGTEQAGYFAAEVAQTRNMTLQFTGLITDLHNMKNAALKDKYDYIIVNVDMLTSPTEETAEVMRQIQLASPAKIIILAKGYSLQSKLVQTLTAASMTSFLTATNLAEIKMQLEQALDGTDNAPEVSTLVKELEKNTEIITPTLPQSTYTTVAVAGCIDRIGTTTQCIQMVKYLNANGRKACYIEMNTNGYLAQLKTYYDDGVQIDEGIGKIMYQNVDLFYRQDKISEILKLGYDFYVYDFGVYEPEKFALIPFLEKNLKFIVCGSKPNELPAMQQALQTFYNSDVQYIFSFAPEDEQSDLLQLMEDKSAVTYFAPYSPDCFFYSSSSSIWEKIFGHFPAQTNTPQKKKFSLFKKQK